MQNPYDRYTQTSIQSNRSKVSKQPKKRPQKAKRNQKRPSSSKPSSLMVLSLSFFGLCLSLYIFAYTEEFLSFVNRIEIGTNRSMASDSTKTEKPPEVDPSVALPVGKVSEIKSNADHLTMKNADIYKALADKRRALEKKERRLSQLEEELQKQKNDIEAQLKEMQEMRRSISSKLDRKVAADKQSVDKLVGVYSSMKPKNAAVILSDINEDLAIKILGKMKKQNAAEILNYVKPEKAQVLSEKFTGIKK